MLRSAADPSQDAGDAFNAGYLAARLAGAPPLEAPVEGARCGAAIASALGDTGTLFEPDPRDGTSSTSSEGIDEKKEEARDP